MAKEAAEETPAIPLGPVAPQPLTADEITQGEKAFQEKIRMFLDGETKCRLGVLMLNWDKGNFIIDMMNDPKTYANHTPADSAKALGVSESSAFKYRKFASTYSKEKVMELAQAGVNWFDVALLLSLPAPEKREGLEAKLMHPDPKKRITHDELKERVKEINVKEKTAARAKGAKVSERGGVRPIVTIRSFETTAQALVDKQKDFKDAYTQFRDMEEGQSKSETKDALKTAFATIKTLGAALVGLEEFRARLTAKDKK
jgi:hypothetical protein